MAIYRDINLDFDRHPVTGDVVAAVDVEAIKKSLRNLVQYSTYDAPFDPSLGSGVRRALFENFTPIMAELIRAKITEIVNEREPRVQVQRVVMYHNDEHLTLEVTIYFKIKDLNRLEEITVFVERTK